MTDFPYDSSFHPPAQVIPFGLGLPDETAPRRMLSGLIDSGADVTLSPAFILREIGAKLIDRRVMLGANGTRQRVNRYQIVIYMPTGVTYGIRAIATRDPNEIILGRDVLNQWRITLDGPGEIVEIEA
jgi:hypothetical protein